MMQMRIAVLTLAGIAAIAAVVLTLPARTTATVAQPASHRPRAKAKRDVKPAPAQPSPQPFEDVRAACQHFADELGRLKERNETVSPADLANQADAENSYSVSALTDPGKKLNAQKIYAHAKPGVVVVGGLYKCDKCQHWHARSAGGFVVRHDGLIVTNLACGGRL